MKTIKNKLMEIAPERVQTLDKIRDILSQGRVKDYTIDEQIEMSDLQQPSALLIQMTGGLHGNGRMTVLSA